jgi:hypothetical protein
VRLVRSRLLNLPPLGNSQTSSAVLAERVACRLRSFMPAYVRSKPGESLDQFAAELVMLAWCTNTEVVGLWQQTALKAKVGMTRDQVLKAWRGAHQSR